VEQLTLLLFERMGILLMLTFILTRTPLFRNLPNRKMSFKHIIYYSLIFGMFGIMGTYGGVVVSEAGVSSTFLIIQLAENELLAGSALVGVVIGGLLGGPVVGFGAGLIAGIHLYVLGGFGSEAAALSAPLTGLMAAAIAVFFSNERVISPFKALFIGMFAPILQMCLILLLAEDTAAASVLINLVGIPMVLANSVAMAIFTTMIHVVLKEEMRTAALETERALLITEQVLPHLSQGLNAATAEETARILKYELKAEAVAVTDTERVLVHILRDNRAIFSGEPIMTELSRLAIQSGEVQFANHSSQFQPHHPGLGAAIIVPFSEGGRVAGLIKLFFKRAEQIRSVEVALARGLSKLITSQLNVSLAEKLSGLMKDAELKVLQAQINPHFLFNTLNSIVSLIRTDPDSARHVTLQLGSFMRLNLKMTQSKLIPIKQELDHLQSYLEIIKVRFIDQFDVILDIESDLRSFMIPPGTLQPLVENSIQHGLKGVTSDGLIRIKVNSKGTHAVLTVEDNGTGIAEEVIDHLGKQPMGEDTEERNMHTGTGIGVYNVNQRLISLFGSDAKLHIANRKDGRSGTRITFEVPYV
jgi:two-component system sensor histidine kinase LytS